MTPAVHPILRAWYKKQGFTLRKRSCPVLSYHYWDVRKNGERWCAVYYHDGWLTPKYRLTFGINGRWFEEPLAIGMVKFPAFI